MAIDSGNPDPGGDIPDRLPIAKDENTVLIHFYRGELGRIMAWRQRLDATTHWAVIAATAMTTFAFGNPGGSHLILCFAHLFVLLLLFIEARRYRYYDAFRARVRLIEAHFLVPIVMRNPSPRQGDWRTLLAEDLILPTFKIPAQTAVYRRFRNNYGWIFLLLTFAWIAKVWSQDPASHSPAGFFTTIAHSQPLPPPVFWSLLAALYFTLGWLTVASLLLKDTPDEFHPRNPAGARWNI